MKVNMKLTADEFQNVVDAVMNTAYTRGYDIDDNEFMLDIFDIVDVALSAIGVEIVPDTEDEEEVEPNKMEFDCEGDCENCPDPCPEYAGDDEDAEYEEEPVEQEIPEEVESGENALFTEHVIAFDCLMFTESGKDIIFQMVARRIAADNRIPPHFKCAFALNVFEAVCMRHGISPQA